MKSTAIHPSKHPSQGFDGAQQNRQETTENSVNIDKIHHHRHATTDQFPFTLSRSGVRVPQRPLCHFAEFYKRPLPTRIQPESDAPTKVAETIWILKFIVHGAVLAHKMLH